MILLLVRINLALQIGVLNFIYKLFAAKYVPAIILPSFSTVDELGLTIDENMIDATLLYGHAKIHVLKELIHEAKSL